MTCRRVLFMYLFGSSCGSSYSCGVFSDCACGVFSDCSCGVCVCVSSVIIARKEDVDWVSAGCCNLFNSFSVRALNLLKVSCNCGILAFLSAAWIKINMWKQQSLFKFTFWNLSAFVIVSLFHSFHYISCLHVRTYIAHVAHSHKFFVPVFGFSNTLTRNSRS